MLVWVAWPTAAAVVYLVGFSVWRGRPRWPLMWVTPAQPPPQAVRAVQVVEPTAVIPPSRQELEQ